MSKISLFADRIENIAVTGPLVRFELSTLERPTAPGQAPTAVVTHTVVMPLQGFLALREMQDKLVNQLVQEGVLKKKGASPAPEALPPLN